MNKSFSIVAPLLVAMLLLGGNSWAEDNQPSLAANEDYEMDSWTSAKEINTIEAYEVYLSEHPNGRHVKFAQAAMNKIKKTEAPKGSEEHAPSKKETGDVVKQPAAAAPAVQPTTEVPAASSAELKTAPAAPATPSAAEPTQKQ